eukprot:m.99063 g.99063  ORF g.99063 m.99063 type:complete len:149 (+) comp13661_c1_seq2:577-1023(+)
MGSNAKILSLEDTSIPSLLAELYKTNVLIGMHGSALIFSIFLPPKAGVIELFPYGVPPEHYTPYKTLTKLAGMDLQYASWRNHNRDKTITHPDWPRHLGGIAHLPHDIQEKVKGSSNVPLHKCCDNPFWLFRSYYHQIDSLSLHVKLS